MSGSTVGRAVAAKPGGLSEVVLTLPVFIAYQLGVVFLRVRNGADIVTSRLLEISQGDRTTYLELTAAIGIGALVLFGLFGGRGRLSAGKLLQIVLEGAAYATAMGVTTTWVVGKLFAGPSTGLIDGPLPGIVMSMGAGFYEELFFRVLLFGVGVKVLVWLFVRHASSPRAGSFVVALLWAVICASVFSGMHYVGALGDTFNLRSFVARAVLGLALTLIYAVRGFAAAVWTHALYDSWVLIF